jgi:hypothetical protein
VAPQGYAVAPPASSPLVVPPASRPGARTQLAGAAAPLAPGESIPVLQAPPRRPRTLPGTEIRVVPLILVGVVFAAIGVAVTLVFMLSAPSPTEPTGPHAHALPTTTVTAHSPASTSTLHGPPGPQGPATAGINRGAPSKGH